MSNFFYYKYIIWKAVYESRPDVGSSSIRQWGSETNSMAIDSLFLSPPDKPFLNNPPTNVFSHFFSYNNFIVSATFF